jgi:charged multivesicular body protein 3
MMKAGLIEEMMDDVMDSVNETEEEEVNEEVQKVLQEVAGDEIAQMPDAGRTKVKPEKTEEVCSPFACI